MLVFKEAAAEPGAHFCVRVFGSAEVPSLPAHALTVTLSWAPTYLWYCLALSDEEGLVGGINQERAGGRGALRVVARREKGPPLVAVPLWIRKEI